MVHVRHLIAGATLLALISPWSAAQGQENEPPIDPLAEEIIQRWSEHSLENTHIRFVAEDVSDVIEQWGQRVTFFHTRTVTISRPNRLRLESRGDTTNRDFIYDGSTATLFDLDHSVYTQVEFSGTNQEMIDMLLDRYGVVTPLADFIATDRATILDNVRTGHYIGLSQVGEHACHHLAFTQETIDWQAWIEVGDQPNMRRLIVTDKMVPGHPQYMLTVVSASLPDAIPAEEFAFEPPMDAERVDMVPLDTLAPEASPEIATAQE